jgi:ParB-like chromosome segregation protein Spo0J
MMERPDLQEFADDIKKRGLEDPIIMHEGKILDGRNRYQACLLAAVKAEKLATQGSINEKART